jgi:hypothetical protein
MKTTSSIIRESHMFQRRGKLRNNAWQALQGRINALSPCIDILHAIQMNNGNNVITVTLDMAALLHSGVVTNGITHTRDTLLEEARDLIDETFDWLYDESTSH